MSMRNELPCLYRKRPGAFAEISGNPEFPSISGRVDFYQLQKGVLVVAEISGLPQEDSSCPLEIFGFHIHEGRRCSGSEKDPFSDSGPHFNPETCPHPAHEGDLPPLFGNRGYAFMSVFTNRFTLKSIIGRTVIIHGSPDDFTTQPSGNSGKKIACGEIHAAGRA